MGDRFPFFYYDILARIIPGALTVVVLAYLGIEMPDSWSDLIHGSSGKTSSGAEPTPPSGIWDPVVLSAVYAGGCYAMGVLYEVVFLIPPLRACLESCFDRAFRRSARNRDWRRPVDRRPLLANPGLAERLSAPDVKWIRRHCWNWLMLRPCEGRANAFAHAHRFQAESKMLQHALLTAVVLIVGGVWKTLFSNWSTSHLWWTVVISLVAMALFALGAYLREGRRWLQVLDSLDELNDHSDDYLNLIQAQCEDLGRPS